MPTDAFYERYGDPGGKQPFAIARVDGDPLAIAHNDVLILDGARVVTGSFNFTRSADTRNAENVVIPDSPAVAAWFLANWTQRRDASRVFVAE